MATYKRGDIVKVPFPYTDRATRQFRPALVVSTGVIEDSHGLLWVVMITSAENRGWAGDVSIKEHALAGLPVASLVRTAKIATIEASDATKLGMLPLAVLNQVKKIIKNELGFSTGARRS